MWEGVVIKGGQMKSHCGARHKHRARDSAGTGEGAQVAETGPRRAKEIQRESRAERGDSKWWLLRVFFATSFL